MVDRHLDDHTGRGLSAKTGEEKNPKFYFAIYIQLDLVFINFYVIKLIEIDFYFIFYIG